MALPISSYNTILKWGTTAVGVTKVIDIVDFGDLSGDPNMIDTTNLSNQRQTQIPGTLSGDNITFTVNYTSEDYALCQAEEDKDLYFSLTFQDGSGFTWQGRYRLSVPGKGVDEAIQFVINVSVSSDMEHFTA
jgi:Phage tail protein.